MNLWRIVENAVYIRTVVACGAYKLLPPIQTKVLWFFLD